MQPSKSQKLIHGEVLYFLGKPIVGRPLCEHTLASWLSLMVSAAPQGFPRVMDMTYYALQSVKK